MLGGSFIGKDPRDYTKAEIDTLLQMYAEITSFTGALKLPSGTTLERPASPNEGYIRENTDTNDVEVYLGGQWRGLTYAATGGGSNKAFLENDTAITTSYTITSGKNAMTAGPVTINDGVVVTIPDGSTWTVV